MSNVQFAINAKMLENMQKNPAHNLLGDKLVKITMQKAEIAGKRVAGNAKLATKENHAESLASLSPDALIEFVVEIIAPRVFTSFSHKLLAEQNHTAQEVSDKFKVYANAESIELERDSFLGEAIQADAVHSLIKQFVKNSKETNKIARRWRKTNGAYQIKVKGEFVPYAPQADSEESENLAPSAIEA